MSKMEQEVWGMVCDVSRHRRIPTEEILSDPRNTPGSVARRAICVVMQDKYGLKPSSTQPMSWTEMAGIFGRARSALYESAKAWRKNEGSENGSKEKQLRARGYLPKTPLGSIDDMIEALSKKGLKRFAYWHSRRKL